ncbi:SH3 domain-containing protein [Exiguobacterium sp. A1_3_1]|uniref:SH3 domain-containing protein n=1 Tax=Exiguobacterium sp. A1_3_1 TaxID=2651871 RepID=UPI003B84B784
MKGIKFLIAVMLIGTVFSYNLKMAGAATKTETLYVVADNLNVREKASTKSKKVGSLKLGSKVKVYSKTKSGWSKIDYKQKKAYVFSEYIKEAPKNQFSRIKFFAKQGQIEPALPLVINNKVSSLINILGKPESEYSSGQGFHIDYRINKLRFVITDPNPNIDVNPESYKQLSKKAYISTMKFQPTKKAKNTYRDLKSALGKPDSVTSDNTDSDLMASYDLGKYYVSYLFPKKDYNDERISDNNQFYEYQVLAK